MQLPIPPLKITRKLLRNPFSALASLLYNNAEEFCQCAKDSSEKAPLCPSFFQFKTLLYESLDACHSLDEIDCDAWNEFYMPCKLNIVDQYTKVSWGEEQCDFVKKGCGTSGPFPAFRKLDCDREVPKPAWDFYEQYASSCLKGDNGIAPKPSPSVPVPSPSQPVAPSTPTEPVPTPTNVTPKDNTNPSDADGSGVFSPTQKPYIPSDGPKKPYSPSDASSGSSSSSKKPKKRHFFRNFFLFCCLAGVGYYLYKRRTDSFNFIQYRRMRNFDYDAGESEMYGNLNSSTTFEPPSLPPPPAHEMT